MLDSAREFFSTGSFMPHGHCFLWRPDILWTRITSDILIAISYYSIPVALLYFIKKRKDLVFNWIFVMFAVFILACGTTHIMDILVVWSPRYGLETVVKAITAVASLLTAVALWPMIPKALKIPSSIELKNANIALQKQIQERMQVEQKLRELNVHLEDRVKERTLALQRDNIQRKKIEERLAIALDAAHMGTWELDIASGVITRSLRHDQIFGYKSLLPKWSPEIFLNHIVPEDRENAKQCFALSQQSGQLSMECRIMQPDRNIRWITVRGSLARDQHDQPISMAGIVMDVTEIKRVEQTALEAANVKAEFLANMSHEIRTPLNAIVGMSSLILDSKLNKRQTEDIMTIKRAGDKLLMLINDILDFSKIDAGKLELESSDFEVQSLLKDSLELVSLKAEEKNLTLNVHVGDDIPNRLRGDPGRLLQILVNLLSNAVKFTGNDDTNIKKQKNNNKNSIDLSVTKIQDVGNQLILRFEVRDTGIGLSEEAKFQLFNPFSQGDSSMARKYGGTGLGLSICKKLVDLMGGQIGAEGEYEKGAIFWFMVPLEKVQSVVLEHNYKIPSKHKVERKKKAKRILIAEDNATNQMVILRFCQKLGHRADAVADGLEVLQATERYSYDLIFMDCQMPEMDGYEVTRRIRKRELEAGKKRIPIVALTAHALSGDRKKCLAAGMDDYITKPVIFSVVEETIDQWTNPSLPQALKEEKSVHRISNESSYEEPLVSMSLEQFKALDQLQIEGKPDIVLEVINIFFNTAPNRLKKMQDLMSEHKIKELSQEAHGLKSSCSSIGAQIMTKICKQIEELVNSDSANLSGPKLLEQLTYEFNEVMSQLRVIAEQRVAMSKQNVA